MADIRIKDLATTAASTASDDFVAVDGSANGTRKLNAYSPTFGGNLTVSGTGGSASTISTIGTGTNAEQNSLLVDATTSGTPAAGYGPSIRFTRKGNDGGSSSTSGAIKSVAIAGTSGNQYNADIIIAPRLGGSLIDALTVKTDGGATIAGNLTVSGTGNSTFAGNLQVSGLIGHNSVAGDLDIYSGNGTGTEYAVNLYSRNSSNDAWIKALVAKGTSTTLAGNLTVSGGTITSGSGTLTLNSSANTVVLQSAGTTALTLDSSQNATFAGKVTAGTWADVVSARLGVATSANSYTATIANNASSGGAYALRLHTTGTASSDYIVVGSSGASAGSIRFLADGAGNFVVNNAAIATTATDGFLYVSTCAGTPTGTPTSYTGRAPIVVDTTNNKLYFYSGGAWRDAGP